MNSLLLHRLYSDGCAIIIFFYFFGKPFENLSGKQYYRLYCDIKTNNNDYH